MRLSGIEVIAIVVTWVLVGAAVAYFGTHSGVLAGLYSFYLVTGSALAIAGPPLHLMLASNALRKREESVASAILGTGVGTAGLIAIGCSLLLYSGVFNFT